MPNTTHDRNLFSVAFNALTRGLCKVDRFVSLSERRQVTQEVLDAIAAHHLPPLPEGMPATRIPPLPATLPGLPQPWGLELRELVAREIAHQCSGGWPTDPGQAAGWYERADKVLAITHPPAQATRG